jgi:cytochrome bd ubiquinol oxidase subunit I
MRTADAVTPSLTTHDVVLSLAAYIVTYLVIFGGGFVLLRRMVRRGPELAREGYEETQTRSARPLSAITHAPTEAAGPGRAFGAARGADDAA